MLTVDFCKGVVANLQNRFEDPKAIQDWYQEQQKTFSMLTVQPGLLFLNEGLIYKYKTVGHDEFISVVGTLLAEHRGMIPEESWERVFPSEFKRAWNIGLRITNMFVEYLAFTPDNMGRDNEQANWIFLKRIASRLPWDTQEECYSLREKIDKLWSIIDGSEVPLTEKDLTTVFETMLFIEVVMNLFDNDTTGDPKVPSVCAAFAVVECDNAVCKRFGLPKGSIAGSSLQRVSPELLLESMTEITNVTKIHKEVIKTCGMLAGCLARRSGSDSLLKELATSEIKIDPTSLRGMMLKVRNRVVCWTEDNRLHFFGVFKTAVKNRLYKKD